MKRILLVLAAVISMAACSNLKTTTEIKTEPDVDRLLERLAAYDSYYTLPNSELIEVEQDGKRGCVDYQGNVVLPVRYDWFYICPRLGLLEAATGNDSTYFYTLDGKSLLANYAGMDNIGEDEDSDQPLIVLWNASANAVGLIGKGGKLVQPFRFSSIVHDNDCYFAYTETDSVYVIDEEGSIIHSVAGYKSVWKYETGYYVVINNDELCGLLDKDWNIVYPCQYKAIDYYSEYGYYVLCDTAGVSHLLHADGTPLPLSAKGWIRPVSHTLFAVRDSSGTNILHLDGRIEETGYGYIHGDTNWLQAFDNEGTICLLDSNADLIVKFPQSYENITPVNDKRAMVTVHDSDRYTYHVIDHRGNLLAQYDEFDFNLGCACHPEYANFIAVSRDGRWGFVDRHCNEIVPLQYYRTYSSTDDKLLVVNDDGTSALLDSTGRTLITAEGLISEFLPDIYMVEYYEENVGMRTYLILPDGRTNATPRQREAARPYMLR